MAKISTTSLTPSKQPKYMVVIGASAGGLNALVEMVKNLPKGLDAAYCIVLHLSHKGIGDYVVHRLSQVTSIHCSLAMNKALIKKDHIYIAPPNQHLLVKDDKLILGSGPEENRFKPSIDVLFRSAAVAYNSFAVGIILSGMLDDGTSGMWAIKRSGGVCIVQDPNQAEYPDMPLSVVNNMEVDGVFTLADIGPFLSKITTNKKRKKVKVPAELIVESKIAETVAVGIHDVEKIGEKSEFACPDCGGNLWKIKDVIPRYRCHIGHAYSENDLVVKQGETASATLWVALRMMEERKHLLKKLEMSNKAKGYKTLSETQIAKQLEMHHHIEQLKKILFDMQKS